MKATVEDKLDRIAEIWNYFIWDYKYCSNKIKFNEDVKTNYFGDILGYFNDTLDIVFTNTINSNFTDKFSYTISFLQAIYIQQDFIQEMLEIFKTGIDKGVLKKDTTYFINRNIRNELIGHPIRKFNDNLISSTLFSYHANDNEITYLRYHKENNFKVESMTYNILEIQERHLQFLEKYFDIILLKLKSILEEYLSELEKIENVMEKHDFKTILNLVELYFEAIFESDFVYDKISLGKVFDKKNEHPRYKNFIDNFYNDLRTAIVEKRNSVKDIFERKVIDKNIYENISSNSIKIVFTSSDETSRILKPRRVNYHYEIGKIATKRNLQDFEFFSSILKYKCESNDLVLSELEHMKHNITNEIEYYTSLRLISTVLEIE